MKNVLFDLPYFLSILASLAGRSKSSSYGPFAGNLNSCFKLFILTFCFQHYRKTYSIASPKNSINFASSDKCLCSGKCSSLSTIVDFCSHYSTFAILVNLCQSCLHHVKERYHNFLNFFTVTLLVEFVCCIEYLSITPGQQEVPRVTN